MPSITPTVGRVVWYYPSVNNAQHQFAPLCALIAHVWSDTCVNLAIFDANGVPMENPPTLVLLVQPGNEAPEGGKYCTWMPYQVTKAHGSDPVEGAVVEPAAETPVTEDAKSSGEDSGSNPVPDSSGLV